MPSRRWPRPFQADRLAAIRSDTGASLAPSLALYRDLLSLRRKHDALAEGDFRLLDTTGPVLAYERWRGDERIVVALNLSGEGQPFALPAGEVMLGTLRRAGYALTNDPAEADVIVVNKSDQPLAAATASDVRQVLALGPAGAPRPPIVQTDALSGAGIADLWEAIDEHGRSPGREERRRGNLAAEVFSVAASRARAHLEAGDFSPWHRAWIARYEAGAAERLAG